MPHKWLECKSRWSAPQIFTFFHRPATATENERSTFACENKVLIIFGQPWKLEYSLDRLPACSIMHLFMHTYFWNGLISHVTLKIRRSVLCIWIIAPRPPIRNRTDLFLGCVRFGDTFKGKFIPRCAIISLPSTPPSIFADGTCDIHYRLLRLTG